MSLAARAAAAPVEQQQPAPLPSSTTPSDKALNAGLRQRASGAAGTSGRVVLETPEQLRSTLEHRAWVASSSVLLAATLAVGLGKVESIGDAAVAGGAVVTAYVVADLVSGIYHWIVDNYGDSSTPVLGSQIAAFQGHHQRPWTITEREFCNNVHLVFKPALPVAGLSLLGAASGATPLAWDVFIAVATALACLAQQFHAWSHMKRSELPAAVCWLQEHGLLISRRDHGAHHKAPFNSYYSIVSGWTNRPLDSLGFYTALEYGVKAVLGVEPRSWYDTPEDWLEQQRPESP